LKSALITILTSDTDVADLVGSRVYVGYAPQHAAMPHLVLTLMDSEEFQLISGTTGSRQVDFDIDCRAKRSVTAESVGDAVRDALTNYSGTVGSDTVHAIMVQSESNDYEPPADASQTGIHTVTIDVTCQYSST